jgi:hypothetical protein
MMFTKAYWADLCERVVTGSALMLAPYFAGAVDWSTVARLAPWVVVGQVMISLAARKSGDKDRAGFTK